MTGLKVSAVQFTAGTSADVVRGLLGYVSFRLNDRVHVDGVGVRRTAAGRLTLAWPMRIDRHGDRHPLFYPIGNAARRDLEAQVLAGLQRQAAIRP